MSEPSETRASFVARAAVADHGAMQKAPELARLLGIVHDLSPRTILEIGGMAGGTAWAFQQVTAGAVIVTVDSFVLTGRMEYAGAHVLINADSHDAGTLQRVRIGAPLVDFLFIDGDHSYEGAKQDFWMYGPLVRPGGIIAFHDVSVEQPARVRRIHDVIPLWNQLRAIYRHEEIFVPDPTDPAKDYGGIGVLYVEDQQAHRIAQALTMPSEAERQGQIMRPEHCDACGRLLGSGEDGRCTTCASGILASPTT